MMCLICAWRLGKIVFIAAGFWACYILYVYIEIYRGVA